MGGWAEAIGAGTSLLGSIIGGSQERGAVKRAGTTLANASQAEVDQIYARLREINPMLADAFNRARQSVTSTADYTGTHLEDTAQQANTYLDPYMQAGTGAAKTLSDLTTGPQEQFGFQFSEDDPSYQFRLAEGQKALERSAAARGTLLGGGTLKALTNYGQNAASQEYQAAFNRAKSTFDVNQQARQQRMQSLADLTRIGGSSAERAGLNLTGAAQNAGDWRNRAAALEGGWDIESAKTQAGNTLSAEEQARQMRLAGAQATAESIAGAGKITGNMWAQGGRSLGDLVSMSPWNSRGGGSTPGQWNSLPTTGASGGYNMPYWQQVGLGQDKPRA